MKGEDARQTATTEVAKRREEEKEGRRGKVEAVKEKARRQEEG